MVIMEESRMFKMSPRLIPTTRNVLRSWRASNGMVFVLIAIPPIRWPITSTWGKENWVIEWKLTKFRQNLQKGLLKVMWLGKKKEPRTVINFLSTNTTTNTLYVCCTTYTVCTCDVSKEIEEIYEWVWHFKILSSVHFISSNFHGRENVKTQTLFKNVLLNYINLVTVKQGKTLYSFTSKKVIWRQSKLMV